ncbi:MAG TPA: 2OG-Fe(II) oxygenase, partial [Balneola sp.]|nr:2OG-Fe(II) oxygenase [Balneola sp.]
SEYEGGDLEFKEYTLNAEAYEKGSIIMFDSSHKHRVSPVTRGVRHSLVGWFR